MDKALLLNKQFISFLAVNGLAAIFNFSSRIVFSMYFSYVTAIILAFCVGISSAYLLCRFFVFRPQRNTTLQQVGFFIGVNLIAVLQTIVISLLFANYIFRPLATSQAIKEAVAHFIGLSVPIFTSYFGHKFFTFR